MTSKLNSLTVAAELAKKLSHGCAPERLDFVDVRDLFTAMDEAANADNARQPKGFQWAKPWSKNADGSILSHRTVSGRMGIEVGNNFIRIDLFSPRFGKGNEPFFTLEVRDGVLIKANVVESARTVVARIVAQENNALNLNRLDNVGRFIIPVIGDDNFFRAADAWTAQAVAKQLIQDRQQAIAWCRTGQLQGYSESYRLELLRRSESDLVVYTDRLVDLQKRDGVLV